LGRAMMCGPAEIPEVFQVKPRKGETFGFFLE
jgi:hypothetical protein